MTYTYPCGCIVDCPSLMNRNLIFKCDKHQNLGRIYPLSEILPKIEVPRLVIKIPTSEKM